MYDYLANLEEHLESLTDRQISSITTILDNNMVAMRGNGVYPITYSTLAQVSDEFEINWLWALGNLLGIALAYQEYGHL